MPSESYINLSLREFRKLKELADSAIAQAPGDSLFTTLGNGENSIADIVKHLAGNMRSRWRDFLTTDGEKPDRNRDSEFELTPEDTREHLLERWEQGWQILFDALTPLGDSDVDRTVTIRGEPLTVLQAVTRQISHYGYHVGQIVLLAKHFAGDRWESLSIPRGESEKFNRDPKKYIALPNL